MLKFWPFQSPVEVVLAAPEDGGASRKTRGQIALGARALHWQLWKPAKPEEGEPSPQPVPDIAAGLRPMLVTVTVWLGAVVPTWTEPKSRLVGVIRNCGLTPVPLSVTLKFCPFQSPMEFVLAAPAEVGEKL